MGGEKTWFVSRVDMTYPLAHRPSNTLQFQTYYYEYYLHFKLLFHCGNCTGKQSLIFPMNFIYGFGRLSCALSTV
jgi:hypothetical protein